MLLSVCLKGLSLLNIKDQITGYPAIPDIRLNPNCYMYARTLQECSFTLYPANETYPKPLQPERG